jgi:N utilization substance protein A
MKGSRVQSVVKELSGERVDIVPWSEEAQQFVTKALSPARVQSMRVDRDRQEMAVVVDDDQLSLAIGREGQNVRLAVRLTGWRIDLLSSSEMGQRERLDKDLRLALDEVEGLTEAQVALLMGAGLHTLKDFNAASAETLAAIEGLSAADIETMSQVAARREEEIKQAFSEQLESESQLFDEDKFDRVPESGSSASGLTFSDEVVDDEAAAEDEDNGVVAAASGAVDGDGATAVADAAVDDDTAAATDDDAELPEKKPGT